MRAVIQIVLLLGAVAGCQGEQLRSSQWNEEGDPDDGGVGAGDGSNVIIEDAGVEDAPVPNCGDLVCAWDEQCCTDAVTYSCIAADAMCCGDTGQSCGAGTQCCGDVEIACIGSGDKCCQGSGVGYACAADATCCSGGCLPAGQNACSGWGDECIGGCGMNESCCIGTANVPAGQQDYLAGCCGPTQTCETKQQANGEITATCVLIPLAAPVYTAPDAATATTLSR